MSNPHSILEILEGRGKDLPSDRYSYKLANEQYGMDVAIGDNLDADPNTMSIWIPIANGERRDGVGDLLEVTGIVTERHIKNPICLFDHGKQVQLPIGIARSDPFDINTYTFRVDPQTKSAGLRAYFYQGKDKEQLQLSRGKQYDHALFCEQTFDMASKGFLKSGSVGYQVLEAEQLPPDYRRGTPQGLHLKKILMLEGSLVVLPANQDTVAKMLAMPTCCGKALSPFLIKSLTPYAPPRKAISNGYRTKAVVDEHGDIAGSEVDGPADKNERVDSEKTQNIRINPKEKAKMDKPKPSFPPGRKAMKEPEQQEGPPKTNAVSKLTEENSGKASAQIKEKPVQHQKKSLPETILVLLCGRNRSLGDISFLTKQPPGMVEEALKQLTNDGKVKVGKGKEGKSLYFLASKGLAPLPKNKDNIPSGHASVNPNSVRRSAAKAFHKQEDMDVSQSDLGGSPLNNFGGEEQQEGDPGSVGITSIRKKYQKKDQGKGPPRITQKPSGSPPGKYRIRHRGREIGSHNDWSGAVSHARSRDINPKEVEIHDSERPDEVWDGTGRKIRSGAKPKKSLSFGYQVKSLRKKLRTKRNRFGARTSQDVKIKPGTMTPANEAERRLGAFAQDARNQGNRQQGFRTEGFQGRTFGGDTASHPIDPSQRRSGYTGTGGTTQPKIKLPKGMKSVRKKVYGDEGSYGSENAPRPSRGSINRGRQTNARQRYPNYHERQEKLRNLQLPQGYQEGQPAPKLDYNRMEWQQEEAGTPTTITPAPQGHSPVSGIVPTHNRQLDRLRRLAGKSIKSIRSKYRPTKSLRKTLKHSKEGRSLILVSTKDMERVKDAAGKLGIGVKWIGSKHKGVEKLVLTGSDTAIDQLAGCHGLAMR